MKKNILILLILISFSLKVDAQMMNQIFNSQSIDKNEIIEHTLREEEEGKKIWEKFKNKEINCSDLNDEQFGAVGEYFMGQMTGEYHAAMNAMMIQMHGEEGEKQIHIAMGKRFLDCDSQSTLPIINNGWMPMMNMMGNWFYQSDQNKNQNGSYPFFNNNLMNNMMGFGFTPFNWFGWIFMILIWLLIIIGVIALIKWLIKEVDVKKNKSEKTALDILKERYSKGEISKEEFEEKKKDLL